MGFVTCIAPCVVCQQPFSFHPHRVPSVRVQGERQPVCKTCMEAANEKRKELGLEVLEILPDAYEACPEEEL